MPNRKATSVFAAAASSARGGFFAHPSLGPQVAALLLALSMAACGSNADTSPSGTANAGTDPSSAGDGLNGDSNDPDPSFPRDCFWVAQSDPNALNVLYPDEFAIYWVASIDIPPGGAVLFEGEYPHARYSSFNLYNSLVQPIDALADAEIEPDADSVNPARVATSANPGDGNRLAENRTYTVRVISGLRPDNPAEYETNTLYSFQTVGSDTRVPSNTAVVIYRVYIPDAGRDLSGDVGLPRVSIDFDGDGVGEVAGTDACEAMTGFEVPPTVADEFANADSLPFGPATGSTSPPQWLKFENLIVGRANRYNGTPVLSAIHDTPLGTYQGNSGGFASNAHNAYLYMSLSQQFGSVGAFEARFPKTPPTLHSDARMTAADMRYWSICTNDKESQRFIDCMFDEETVAATNQFGSNSAGDRRVFVVSSPADRPSNATPECGVNWLAFGPTDETYVILRNMLSENSFAPAIQFVPPPSGHCEAPAMGEYFPYGANFHPDEFEALGCPVDPDLIPDTATQYPATEDCRQQPTGTIQ